VWEGFVLIWVGFLKVHGGLGEVSGTVSGQVRWQVNFLVNIHTLFFKLKIYFPVSAASHE
jgi:hypothetical protein